MIYNLYMSSGLVSRRIEDVLLELARSFPVVTVTGPRQAGKTTLCRMAFGELPYVSLEDPDQRRFATSDPRGFLDGVREGAILDEIQRAPDLPSYLQGMVDEDPRPGRFVLTGSVNLALQSRVTQSLAGRTAMLELLPLDLDERNTLAPADDLWQVLWEGSYPAIHHRRIRADRWLGAYVRTYVERDVRQQLAVSDLERFETFLGIAASNTANLVNLSALGEATGVSHNTARSWLSVLEAGYLLQRLTPLHRNLRKRVTRAPKLCFLDSGLVCWLLGIRNPEELRRHPLRGAVFESWVAAEIRKAIAASGHSSRLHHWRDHRGREVDLVVDRGRDLVAVEAKSGATIDPSFFRSLEYFETLAREAVPQPQGGVRPVLVYGGEARQERSSALVLPWRQIQRFPWGEA